MLFKNILHKALKRPYCSAVIAAAGSSQRMQGENKMFSLLCGVPVIAHTLLTFETTECIDEIVIAAREEDLEKISGICSEYNISKVTKILTGGATRPESVFIGVSQTSKKADVIAIQDGGRPLVTSEIIEEAVKAAIKYKAAVPAVPVIDTIKKVKDGFVTETPRREDYVAVQTPQTFKADIIKAALTNALDKKLKITDDCMAAEALGVMPYITKGSYENIKITTPSDLETAESILQKRGRLK